MSDWCAWIEEKLLKCKEILVDDPALTDEEFYRIIYQIQRMRHGDWKEGQL